MNMKLTSTDLLRICLLFFVCASIVVLSVKAIFPPQVVVPESPHFSGDSIVVYSVHAKVRCPTCSKMEELTRQTLDAHFAREQADEKIEWRELDYELPENAEFAARHKIATSTVLVVRIENGQEVESKNFATDAWGFVRDEPKFIETFAQHFRKLLDKSASPAASQETE